VHLSKARVAPRVAPGPRVPAAISAAMRANPLGGRCARSSLSSTCSITYWRNGRVDLEGSSTLFRELSAAAFWTFATPRSDLLQPFRGTYDFLVVNCTTEFATFPDAGSARGRASTILRASTATPCLRPYRYSIIFPPP
jgi:hypothetical protein